MWRFKHVQRLWCKENPTNPRMNQMAHKTLQMWEQMNTGVVSSGPILDFQGAYAWIHPLWLRHVIEEPLHLGHLISWWKETSISSLLRPRVALRDLILSQLLMAEIWSIQIPILDISFKRQKLDKNVSRVYSLVECQQGTLPRQPHALRSVCRHLRDMGTYERAGRPVRFSKK